MKRTTLYISAALALAFALAGCTKEDTALLSEASEGTPMTFTATGLNPAIETTGATAASRATVDGDWDGVTSVALLIGGEVKVYDVTADAADNTRATLSRENDPFWWTSREDITASAWWPYDADDIAQMPAVVVLEDQSEWANFAASDHISAEEQSVTYGAPTLHFTHRTALVHIVLTEYTEGLESVRLTGLSTEGGNPGIIIPYDKGNHTYSALVLPQEVTQGTAFIACTFDGGKTFGYRMQESVEWTAGEEYTYTVSLVAADPGYTYNEATNTYEVYNAKGLKNIAKLVNEVGKTDINITLTDNIDLTGIDWTPIGKDDNKAYTGTFDGNGKTITGLTFNQPETNNVGLIGNLGENGMVQDVKLDKVNIKANNNVGGIVGTNKGGSIIGCSVSGDISGARYVGGVMGVFGIGNSVVTACYHEGSVSGSEFVGGVAGESAYGSLTACYHVGNVTGSQYVGGVTGIATGSLAKVIACYWNGYDGNGIGLGRGEATQVDGTTVTWKTAVDAMNAALSGKGWQYELTGVLPTLKKQ